MLPPLGAWVTNATGNLVVRIDRNYYLHPPTVLTSVNLPQSEPPWAETGRLGRGSHCQSLDGLERMVIVQVRMRKMLNYDLGKSRRGGSVNTWFVYLSRFTSASRGMLSRNNVVKLLNHRGTFLCFVERMSILYYSNSCNRSVCF